MPTAIYLNISPSAALGNSVLLENASLIKKATLLVRALDSNVRQQMVELIESQGRATVTEIHTRLNIEQPIASRHLAVLRQAKIVNANRAGKFVFYTVNTLGVEKVIGCMKELINQN